MGGNNHDFGDWTGCYPLSVSGSTKLIQIATFGKHNTLGAGTLVPWRAAIEKYIQLIPTLLISRYDKDFWMLINLRLIRENEWIENGSSMDRTYRMRKLTKDY